MKLVPTAIGYRVLVKPANLEDIDPVVAAAKQFGIVGLDQDERSRKATIDQGTVLEIGPDAFSTLGKAPWCKVGDLIAYPKNAGKFIKFSDDPQDLYLIINDEDVVTVLKEINNG